VGDSGAQPVLPQISRNRNRAIKERCILRFLTCEIFEDIAGLAVELAAYCGEGREADGARLAGLQHGKVLDRDADRVGEIAEPALAPGEHHIEVDDDGHKALA
jgi:hypothetical protein